MKCRFSPLKCKEEHLEIDGAGTLLLLHSIFQWEGQSYYIEVKQIHTSIIILKVVCAACSANQFLCCFNMLNQSIWYICLLVCFSGHPSNITTVANKYILFLVKKNTVSFFIFRMTVTAPVAQISVLKRKCFLLLVKIGQSDRTAFTENGTAGKMDTVKMDKNYWPLDGISERLKYAAGAIINVKHCVGFHNVLLLDIIIKITCKICSFKVHIFFFKNWLRNVCKASEGEAWRCIMYFFVIYCTLMRPRQHICHENVHKRKFVYLFLYILSWRYAWIIWIMYNNWTIKWKSCFKTRLTQLNDRLKTWQNKWQIFKTWQNKWQISITHIHMYMFH